MIDLACEWWGASQDYANTHDRQLAVRAEVAGGNRISFIAALTHAPTITLGKRNAETPDPEELRRLGIDLFRANRGGLATYHGPKQLMVYMFLDINRMGIKVRQVVSSIEAGLIEWLRGEGIPATCVKGSPGVYVLNEDERFEKIAAIGLNFSRGISMHGFALYLLEDDEPFSLIEPCGEKGALVTSVEAQSSKSLMPKNCYESVVAQIIESLSLHCKTA